MALARRAADQNIYLSHSLDEFRLGCRNFVGFEIIAEHTAHIRNDGVRGRKVSLVHRLRSFLEIHGEWNSYGLAKRSTGFDDAEGYPPSPAEQIDERDVRLVNVDHRR
ncbi:hypothetical protein GW16_04120 [Xanthomonas arboricola pv. celebensis]|nr:hypothetical protein GW16_04120 [Xanthomonas arboricola pv. celebensis]